MQTRIIVAVVLGVSSMIGVRAASQVRPCNDLCAFIQNVVKEEPTGFARFKGNEVHAGRWWEGSYRPADMSACSVQYEAAEAAKWIYNCGFNAKADDARFSPDEGRRRFAALVAALKTALPSGWDFTDFKREPTELTLAVAVGTTYSTTATERTTNAKVVAALTFNDQESDADWAHVTIIFRQRPASGR